MPTSFPITPTKEPLEALVKSIPELQILLDGLNDNIAKRQIELAEAEDCRPPPGSIRNKGSTESLRPKEDDAISPPDIDVDTHLSHAAPPTRPLAFPSPTSSPRLLLRHSTSPSPQPLPRKRKTDSLASAESGKPKSRTRSMIIVYYDSAVQLVFEELVRHISASRNAMRKGKMAARMASMRKMAELGAEGDEGEIEVDGRAGNGRGFDDTVIAAASPGDEDEDGVPLPALKFVSTRRMGPSRDFVSSKHTNRGLLGVDRPMEAPRRAGQIASSPFAKPGGAPGTGIFEDLDAGLEWCQGMCEHAAHQFLRDGQCVAEIWGIKGRLEEVRGRAQQEVRGEDSREGEGERECTPNSHPNPDQSKGNGADEGREVVGKGAGGVKGPQPRMLRPIQMRRPVERVEKAAEKGMRKETGETPAEIATENSARAPDQMIVKTLDVALEPDADADEDMKGEETLRSEYAALMARSRNSRYQRQ